MPYSADKNEKEILQYWQDHQIFEKTVDQRPEHKPYVFYDGPPFATGLPHYGHILSSVAKDIIPRYYTMKGYRVRRRWGWDCHGLPIESLIEKELNISGKKQIEDMGVDVFNNACSSKVLMYTKEWKKMVDRIGRWIEFDNAYKTMDPSYMESVWWALKTIWDKGLIYEGRKVLLYCPRCETPVSKAEVTMDNSYRDVTEETAVIKFKVSSLKFKELVDVDGPVYMLAWTTTPWTLPGNVALAVGESIEYVVVQVGSEFFVLAKDLVEKVMKGKGYTVVKELKGSELVGLEYEPLFDMPKVLETGKKAYYVATADFVTTEEGTGVVHTAVIYGEDDYNLGVKLDLPMVPMLDSRGHYNDVVPTFIKGEYYKKAEKQVKQYLVDRNLLFAREQHTHSYPHCWRCDTPLIYNAISAWFINIQAVKDRMIELNKSVNWYPDHLKEGRFLNILETAPDWNISRNRYWATPLPFWRHVRTNEQNTNIRTTKNDLRSDSRLPAGVEGPEEVSLKECVNVMCVGSVEELKAKAVNYTEVYGEQMLDDMDLHKHNMDKIRLTCDKCGEEMERIPEVIDCWVEAASMPFAEFHYPFENQETFEKRFPGQYIAEYIAQTRAWFYYMHAIAVLLFDNKSFENVVCTGTILNEKGEKLSKSKKNYTDPWIIIEQFGMDALRYYLMTSVVMQADNLFFSDREVRDVYNKVLNTLSNVVSFYSMYADLRVSSKIQDTSSNVLDQWILAKLQILIKEMTTHLDNYDTVRGGRPIKEFIDELSTWYLRRSRDRFKGDDEQDKQFALQTLRTVLLILSKLVAPYMPFVAEHVYLELEKTKQPGEEFLESVHLELWPEVDELLINQKVLTEMETAQKIVEMGLSLRVEHGVKVRQVLSKFQISNSNFQVPDDLKQIIADELNVRDVVDSFEQDGFWKEKEDGGLKVALNIEITEELKKEGLLREVVRTINQMRKDQKLTIDDMVTVSYTTDDNVLKSVFVDFVDELKSQVLASDVREGEGEEMVIDERAVRLRVEKV